MTNEIKRQNLEMQARQIQGYMILWQTKILSGAYKLEEIKVPTRNADGFDYENMKEASDEYKLNRAIGVLENHARNFSEVVDAFMSAT